MDLIGKYLAGEATPEEAIQLEDLLKDAEHKKEFDSTVQLLQRLPGAAIPQTPSANSSWAELQPLLKKAAPGRLSRISIYRYVAAACFTGILILIGFSLSKNEGADEEQSSNKALITKAVADKVQTDTIPDGSVITINKNSSLAYAVDFNKVSREIKLNGECFFDVVPNKMKPFIISVDDLKIQVVGTSFNVKKDSSNYSVEVQVQSGIVKMYTAASEITLHKGQTGIYTTQNRHLIVKDTVDVNSISYATKNFSFADISLAEACSYLEKAFGVQIKIEEKKFSECRLTAQFENKPISYILDVINATLGTSHQQKDNVIYISGDGCH